MFAKLELTDSIGYEKWDGTPEDPTSTAKARQRYRRRRAEQQS